MPLKIVRTTHTLNAENKTMGRLSSEIALLLQGKNKIAYAPHIDIGDFVTVKNVDRMKFTGKKFFQKKYHHHTGYPGSIKTKTLEELFKKNPSKIFRKVVLQMLPKNKLRSSMIKRLTIL